MKRSESLAALMLAPFAALSACEPRAGTIAATSGLPSRPTAFGSQLYQSDDLTQAIPLLAACGSTYIRATADIQTFDYFDALFPAAAASGMRVILISEYLPQPVDVNQYIADTLALQQRYAAYNPMWEIWNEPNLAHYWGAPPNKDAYAQLAIATGTALRNAGATDVLSGGTSGVDVNWIYGLHTRNVFDVLTGCAVHSYIEPKLALNEYLQAQSLLPPGIQIYTTEACVTNGEPTFFEQMWYLHRTLSLPMLLWCEFRDGTAGSAAPYNMPMGLVTTGYTPKPVYYTTKSLVTTSS